MTDAGKLAKEALEDSKIYLSRDEILIPREISDSKFTELAKSGRCRFLENLSKPAYDNFSKYFAVTKKPFIFTNGGIEIGIKAYLYNIVKSKAPCEAVFCFTDKEPEEETIKEVAELPF